MKVLDMGANRNRLCTALKEFLMFIEEFFQTQAVKDEQDSDGELAPDASSLNEIHVVEHFYEKIWFLQKGIDKRFTKRGTLLEDLIVTLRFCTLTATGKQLDHESGVATANVVKESTMLQSFTLHVCDTKLGDEN